LNKSKIAIIGGGAAGFFSAITAAESNPNCEITILEKSPNPLSKVRVSGGGRCNVTNATFDIHKLLNNYPRGFKELRSVFNTFNCRDTIEWFKSRGVELKTEPDGRVFPVTDKSDTIVQCFLDEAKKRGIKIITGYSVNSIIKDENGFLINHQSKDLKHFDKILIAFGGHSSEAYYDWIKNLGHNIVCPLPSLFAFNLSESVFKGLEGISVPDATVGILNTKFKQIGAILITHWGFSGPAILKLSAFGAVELYKSNYKFNLFVNWVSGSNSDKLREIFQRVKAKHLNNIISVKPYFDLPLRLWKKFIELSGITEELKWNDISKAQLFKLSEILTKSVFAVEGKSPFKEEFVTCGGVSLKEVNFKTMESRVCKGLYFAGEVLDIDGITGGFNFQYCWSTAYIAGKAIVL
jgi:predicted Rossmann fold flavoprotein